MIDFKKEVKVGDTIYYIGYHEYFPGTENVPIEVTAIGTHYFLGFRIDNKGNKEKIEEKFPIEPPIYFKK